MDDFGISIFGFELELELGLEVEAGVVIFDDIIAEFEFDGVVGFDDLNTEFEFEFEGVVIFNAPVLKSNGPYPSYVVAL